MRHTKRLTRLVAVATVAVAGLCLAAPTAYAGPSDPTAECSTLKVLLSPLQERVGDVDLASVWDVLGIEPNSAQRSSAGCPFPSDSEVQALVENVRQGVADSIGGIKPEQVTAAVLATVEAAENYAGDAVDNVDLAPYLTRLMPFLAQVLDAAGVYQPDPNDPEGNTGDGDVPSADALISGAPYIVDNPAVLAEKTALAAHAAAVFAERDAADLAGISSVTSDSSLCLGSALGTSAALGPCQPPIPDAKKIENGLATLHVQETDHTCGPASARSILHSMTGTNLSEASLKSEMKTTKEDGTYWPNLKKALNAHQDYEDFVGEPEKSKLTDDEIMSRVVYAVAISRNKFHGVVLNVDQSKLAYWNRNKSGRHYLTSYGYNRPEKKLLLGDVARSVYGQHTVPLAETGRAVRANKGLVIW